MPQAPTREELEDHLPLHIPYRAWCAVCVRGAGNHDPRRTHGRQEPLGVTVSLDYCFFGGVGEQNMDEYSLPTILILHDDSVDAMWTLRVQSKGVREEIVDWVLQTLEFAGHLGTDLTLKSDQEEAIMALKRAVAARRTSRTTLVESNVRVSKTNTKIERAVGKWRSQLRKLKIHLEDRINK